MQLTETFIGSKGTKETAGAALATICVIATTAVAVAGKFAHLWASAGLATERRS